MLSTLNSVITDNILVSTRDDINYGYGGYKAGSGSHIGDTIYNNRIINYYDYFGRLYNSATGERTSMYRYQENVNNRTNEFDGTGMTGRSDNPTFTDNPTQSASDKWQVGHETPQIAPCQHDAKSELSSPARHNSFD